MKVQYYINIASALIILVGGLMIVFIYPGHMRGEFRVIIGVFVAFYFLARIGQTIQMIRGDRMGNNKGLKNLIDESEEANDQPKRP
jgi:hypothetical protein